MKNGKATAVFRRRAKRRLTAHPKFYFFDAGVYRALRPRGPLDSDDEIDGAAIETLVLELLRAENANHDLGYQLFFGRTGDDKEVDFVRYGERGLHAFEVKRSSRFVETDLTGLRLFCADYPEARGCLFYGGTMHYRFGAIDVVPLGEGLAGLAARLGAPAAVPSRPKRRSAEGRPGVRGARFTTAATADR